MRSRNGTPAQRQLSMSRRSAAYVSVVEPAATPVDVEVAVVLPAHVVGGIRRRDRAEGCDLRVLDRRRVAAGRRLHHGGGDHLHHVVDDHVAERADRIVEVPAILDPEALGHRDLDALDVVPVPDRLEHRVGEPEVEQLVEAHLPEEVVDAQSCDSSMYSCSSAARARAEARSWPNGFSTTTRACSVRPAVGKALDHRAEQERRDLEVEDRRLRALDRLRDARVRRRVAEIALDVGEPCREAVEDRRIQRLAGPLDATPGRAR